MPNTPDNTPSSDAREMYPERSDASEYGGRWQLPISHAVAKEVEVTAVDEPTHPEQLDLFNNPEPEQTGMKTVKSVDKYGHVEGASARALRNADQAYLKEQYRRYARGRGPGE